MDMLTFLTVIVVLAIFSLTLIALVSIGKNDELAKLATKRLGGLVSLALGKPVPKETEEDKEEEPKPTA